MQNELRELWQYRELLAILVQRDLKVRYKNSALGFLWSLLNPLAQVLTITLVMKFMMKTSAPNYHAYVFCATLPWLFFNTAMMDATGSLLAYFNLLRRTYFPRELIPMAAVAANLIHFGLATAVFLVYMAANALVFGAINQKLDWPIQGTVFLAVVPMLGLVLLVTGLSFFVAVWTLYFEDVRFLMETGLRIFYWVVPVLYAPDIILHRHKGMWMYVLYMLNPLSPFITSFQKLILPRTTMPGDPYRTEPMGAPEWAMLAVACCLSLAIALAGYRYFSTRKWRLAERD